MEVFDSSTLCSILKGEGVRSEKEISDYKSYLSAEITRMEDKDYGAYNQSLLETYKVKLETLSYLTRLKDKNDRLAICKWLVGE